MKVRQNDDSHNANDLDVEGHGIRKPADETDASIRVHADDVQGHGASDQNDPGRKVPADTTTDGDDTEGHLARAKF